MTLIVDKVEQESPTWTPSQVSLGNGVTSSVSIFRAVAGGVQYAFGPTVDAEWSANIPLDNLAIYDGSNLKLQIIYQLSAAPSGGDTVEFEVEYRFSNTGDNSDGGGTIFTDAVVQTGRTTEVLYTDLLPTALVGVSGKKFLQLSVMRDSSGGGADSYGGSIWITDIQLIKQ
jgi:hypothetical protein